MDIFERSPLQRLLTSALLSGLLAAGLTFVALLLWTAAHFPPDSVSQVVHIGFLDLMRIEKTPLSNGEFQLSFVWLQGTAWYCLIWIGIMLILGISRPTRKTIA